MQFYEPFNPPEKLSTYLRGTRAADPRSVHGLAVKLGCLLSSTFLSNNLLNAYRLTSAITDAHHLFDEIPHPNAVTWSTINSAYSHAGRINDVISVFRRMQHLSISPNHFVFASILTGCANARDILAGIQIHGSSYKFGFARNTFVSGAMIDMYAKCGLAEESRRVFDDTPEKDAVSYTTMITLFVSSTSFRPIFELFKEMIFRRIWPVGMTFAIVLKVFDDPKKIRQATQVHGFMMKIGTEVDDVLSTGLISMYGRCGGLEEAVRVFDRTDNDVVSWTSLMVAYTQNGYYRKAAYLFQRMMKEKIEIDSFVVASMIKVFSALEDVDKGKEIHAFAIINDFVSDVSVDNSLIKLYGRCSETIMAEKVFHFMKVRDAISWTVMMTCYSQNEHGSKAFLLFFHMLCEGQKLPIFSIISAIQACSSMVSLDAGERMHARITKMGFDANLSVENSLITMYAKCGSINSAFYVFDYMAEKDIVSWNAMIMGFAQHGWVKEALILFAEMRREKIKPDEFTFIGILISCGRAGLVAEGWEYFNMMTEEYGLEPTMAHYGCMVDLLGRSNKLGEAMDFISSMPFEPDSLVWEAMLAACKVHGDVELVKYAAKKILEMEPEDASPYISLSTMDAFMGSWDSKVSNRDEVKSRGLSKEPGKSWVDVHIWSKYLETWEFD
ncbi:putative pentatricopeptide repeat-containing protein [Platanthera guangdongensis]|uniref:Pentatricopeptide repeat-containing protein n=1 Tax=Platanthera guangdongensis TaxID=2320717 RepID=A0ABR2LX91_9ASPA